MTHHEYDKSESRVFLWTDRRVSKVIPDIVTPLTWDLMGNITNQSFINFLNSVGLKTQKELKLFEVFKGKVYFNETLFDELLEQFYIRKRIRLSLSNKNYNLVLKSLIQIIKIIYKTLLLLLIISLKTSFFLRGGRTNHSRFNDSAGQTIEGKLKRIRILLKQQHKNMNLLVTSTVLADIFRQGVDKFGSDWKVPTKNGSFSYTLFKYVNSDLLNGFELINTTPGIIPLIDMKKGRGLTDEDTLKIRQVLPCFKWIFFKKWLDRANSFYKLSAQLKHSFMQTHGQIREQLIEIASKFVTKKIIDKNEDIFSLTLEEIEQLNNSSTPLDDLQNRIKIKKLQREEYQKCTHPKQFKQGGRNIDW